MKPLLNYYDFDLEAKAGRERRYNVSTPIIRQVYDVAQAIEKCGASKELTDAVIAAGGLYEPVRELLEARDSLLEENERLAKLLNSPEIHDFSEAVALEAAHQRERWASDHDSGKTMADWFWLIGYLAGKALHAGIAGNIDKALHHVITTAAACCNWHAAILGKTNMRPGIAPPSK